MIYRYTALRKAGDAQGELKEAKSFEELANFVQHARDNDNRGTKDGAGICAPMKNGYRSKENILPRNWIAIDIDGPHELDANGSPIKTKLSNGKERIKPSIGISSQTISDICTALARYEYFWHILTRPSTTAGAVKSDSFYRWIRNFRHRNGKR